MPTLLQVMIEIEVCTAIKAELETEIEPSGSLLPDLRFSEEKNNKII